VHRPPIVLASTSPQRRAILTQLGLPFVVVAPAYEEVALPVGATDLVREHARGKARSIAAAAGPILGVDTAVVAPDGSVLGKPTDAAMARRMLGALAGAEHVVVSGLALVAGDVEIVEHAVTRVAFATADAATLDAYVATGEWHGRAGGYAIQGRGALLVAEVHGCYSNVVGLPVAVLADALLRIGYPPLSGGDSPASG
jgi:septum formation protein